MTDPERPDLIAETGDMLHDAGQRLAGSIALAAAGFMHLAVGGFVALTGLLAPGWVTALLLAVWVTAAALIWRWRRRRPIVTLLVPFAAAGVWFAVVATGQRLFDWSG
jgi:hypothetical protein